MSIRIIKGNLLDLAEAGNYKYIAHGCNCFHAMGSGIAGEIASRYPLIPRIDKTTERGNTDKLGDYSYGEVSHKHTLARPKQSGWEDKPTYSQIKLDKPFTIINLYTQYKPGKDFMRSIFEVGIRGLNRDFCNETIGIPWIGCGIAGSMDNRGFILDTLLDHSKYTLSSRNS